MSSKVSYVFRFYKKSSDYAAFHIHFRFCDIMKVILHRFSPSHATAPPPWWQKGAKFARVG